jgi:ectoine hydroxylase-related dioxygenase (phytanoyl-CoA dioxygenase family)
MFDIAAEIEEHGFYLARKISDADEIDRLKMALAHSEIARAERFGQTYGARNLLHLADVRAAAANPKITAYLQTLLGPAFQVVRGIFFDKTERANWPVPWHQDLSLAVRERCDLPGWSNWTVKRGVTHVQPPSEILSRMVTIRLHLDDCPSSNGPLRVIPGSHRQGVLRRGEIAVETHNPAAPVVANAGDALFMRPLILHASSPAQTPGHRRVLHLEFAPTGLLPRGLDWAEA